jgi:uncharacterized Zn-binding protein involved in type VI secretion
MLKRYLITLGASTTAGGKVTSASSARLINGKPAALEGDAVHCPSCGADGTIKPDGPRLAEHWNGRSFALHDDLCACHCSPPPRLVSAQQAVCQVIGGQMQAGDGASAPASDDSALRLRHTETSEPFRHRPYRLHLTNKVIEGTTDADGYTLPLSAIDRANLIAWHVDGVAGIGG